MDQILQRASNGRARRSGSTSRSLKAIVALDVQGFSRLVDTDEASIVRLLPRYRALLTREIVAHNGHLFSTAGDGFFAEFANAHDSVVCALSIQKAVARANRRNRPVAIWFRAGIALGEVVEDGEWRYGTVVNVAARIQAKAEPGGVCLTEAVYAEVRNKVRVAFEDEGLVDLKNISRPVRLFRTHRPNGSAPLVGKPAKPAQPIRWELPTIAVLPFSSGPDEGGQRIADILPGEIVAQLGRHNWLGVTSTLTTLVYDGRHADPRAVAADLGVRYVAHGRVERKTDHLSISIELIAASTGLLLWSDRWRVRADAAADALAVRAAATLQGGIERAEARRALARPIECLTAQDHYLRGVKQRASATAEGNRRAIISFQKAIELDPLLSSARARLASCHVSLRDQGWGALGNEDVKETLALAQSAIDVDRDDAIALQVSGMTFAGLDGDVDTGLSLLDRSLRLAPSYPESWARSSMVRIYAGDLDTAERHAEMAIHLSPDNDPPYLPLCALGYAYLFSGRYEDAAKVSRRVLSGVSRPPMAYAILAAASHYSKDVATARKAASALRAAAPDFGVKAWTDQSCFVMPDQRRRLQTALSEVLDVRA